MNKFERGLYFRDIVGRKGGSWYSFEIASFGGEVHFSSGLAKLGRCENANHAQYPTVEINEAPIMQRATRTDPGRFMWGT